MEPITTGTSKAIFSESISVVCMHASTVSMGFADSILSTEAHAPNASDGADQALLHSL